MLSCSPVFLPCTRTCPSTTACNPHAYPPPPPSSPHCGPERTCDRLLAALQLGNASLALAAAEKMNGRLAEAESALRHGVVELRWVLGVGANDVQLLSSSRVEVRGGGRIVWGQECVSCVCWFQLDWPKAPWLRG